MNMRYFPHSLVVLVFGIAVLFAFANQTVIFQDPDTLWHIRAGELIRQHGIHSNEPWSWTAGDYPWINIAWLPDIAMSWLYDLGGLSLLAACTLILFALVIASLAAIGLKLKATISIMALPLFYSAGILAEGMLARPQLLSLLFAAAAYALLRFAQTRTLLWLLPLYLLWSNSHGGYITMFVIIGMFFIEAVVQNQTTKAKWLALIAAGCALLTFANPYGMDILSATFAVLSTPANQLLHEWQTTAPAQYLYLLGWLVLMVIAGGMRSKDIPLADKLLAIFWLVMAMASLRMTYFAAIFSFPYLVQALSAWQKTLPTLTKDFQALSSDPMRWKISLTAVALIVFLLSPWRSYILSDISLPEHIAPKAEVEFLAANYPQLKLMNHYDFGGYLIYRRDLGLEPFIDGRAETAYPRTLIIDYFVLQKLDIGWEKVAADYGIQAFLLPLKDKDGISRSPQIAILDQSPQWKRVFTGDIAAVYIHRNLSR